MHDLTLGFPAQCLDLLGAWHELSIDIELAASPGDEVTVLQMSFSLAGSEESQTYLRPKVEDEDGVKLVVNLRHGEDERSRQEIGDS